MSTNDLMNEQVKETIDLLQREKVDIRQQPISYRLAKDSEEARQLIIRTATQADATVRRFVWLPPHDQLAAWLVDTQARGLMLYGPPGTGKSLLVSRVLPVIIRMRANFVARPTYDLNRDVDELIKRRFIFIDDVGVEAEKVDYGQRSMAFVRVVEACENDLRKMLVFATNLTPDRLKERYGLRTHDRLQRLCKPILMKHESFRRNGNAVPGA